SDFEHRDSQLRYLAVSDSPAANRVLLPALRPMDAPAGHERVCAAGLCPFLIKRCAGSRQGTRFIGTVLLGSCGRQALHCLAFPMLAAMFRAGCRRISVLCTPVLNASYGPS